MKIKSAILFIILVVSVTGMISSFFGQRGTLLSSQLFIQNIEALAQSEAGSISPWEFPNGKPKDGVCNATDNGKRCKASIRDCEGGGSGCNQRKCSAHH